MPGVTVVTATRSGPAGGDSVPSATLFVAGTAQRGAVNAPGIVRSLKDFEALYGVGTTGTSLHQHLQTFFEEGGQRAYVQRVAAADAAIATVKLQSSAASDTGPVTSATSTTITSSGKTYVVNAYAGYIAQITAGQGVGQARTVVSNTATALTVSSAWTTTPVTGAPTYSLFPQIIQLDAASPGAFGNGLSAEIVAGTVLNTWAIKVKQAGVTIYTSAAFATVSAAVAALNKSLVANIIKATDIRPVTVVDTANPVVTTSALAAGAEGSALLDADYTSSLDNFDYELGAGAVAIPEQSGVAIWNGMRNHAANNNRIALCAFAAGTTSDQALSSVSDYGTVDNAQFCAFYWPSVLIPDGTGGSRTVSPESYVAGARTRAHRQFGPWQPAAGLVSEATFVTGLAQTVLRTTGDALDDGGINGLRVIAGNVRVYGARSISTDLTNWRNITNADTVNYVVVQCQSVLEPYVFNVVDARGSLYGRIHAAIVAELEPIRRSGGFFEGIDAKGQQVDSGYSVLVDDSINPAPNLAEGRVAAQVAVRVSPVGDKIVVTITKSSLTSAV
jgi:hypothetical protein